MTDLVTRSNADEADDAAVTADGVDLDAPTQALDAPAQAYEWAPAEPARKKRHLGWWIGVPAGIAVAGLVASSLILIAPGTAVAGVPVGGLTAGAAADAVQQRFAETSVVLATASGDVELTAAELGATVDAKALADEAFASHPMWNIGAWNAEASDAEVTIDQDAATAVLRAAAPDLYTEPVDATVAFDAETAAYVVTDAAQGTGVDIEAVRTALQQAFANGEESIVLDSAAAPVDPQIPTYVAQGTADSLNGMISKAGFYVGSERVVPVDRKTAASWLTVTADAASGTFDIAADQAAIQKVVDGLAEKVDRKAVNAYVITNEKGTVLSERTKGVTGRALGATTGIAAAYAAQLAQGQGAYALEVTETPFSTTAVARMLEVDLSQQRLYLKENGKVVESWLISSGKGTTPTFTGRYTIGFHTQSQTMTGIERINGKIVRDKNGDPVRYSQPNVKWVMYFNGDQAFHGVYWHSNWGRTMSHGCVGMPEWRAQQIYNWAPNGVDVWIHA